MDSTRALLDQLMGKDRNMEPEKRRVRKWDDPDVCEYFLCGFCAHDLFTNTKSDLGPCEKDHDEGCQEAFRKESFATQCRLERKFIRHLQDQIRAVDLRVRRGKERHESRSERDPAPTGTPIGPYAAEINLKTDMIKKMQREAEKLGEDGKIDKLNDLMSKLEALKKEKDALEIKNNASTTPYNLDAQGQTPMTICEICGVWKSDNPEDARAKNHISGKQHLGYELIKNKLKELEEKEGVGFGDFPKDDRERTKSRDRRERDRDRSSDRDRRSRSGRSRRTSRSRSRDRKHKHESSDSD